jgi:hypothetical protein
VGAPPIIFSDDFETGDIRQWDPTESTQDPQRLRLTDDPKNVHSGQYAAEFVAPVGKEATAKVGQWFMPGFDQVYARWYCQFADDFDQGFAMHFVTLSANRPDNKYSSFGKAGWTPKGDDFFVTGLEPNNGLEPRPQGGWPPPGPLQFYTYHIDKKGPWGALFVPAKPVPLERGRWYCLEMMVQANTPGQADGEQAFWLDGKLQGHFKGIRWRTVDFLKVNYLGLDLYIHDSPRVNRVWFDDVVVSTRFIGTLEHPGNQYPHAEFYAVGQWGTREVTFQGNPSSDPDGKVARWVWDFGDGSPPTTGEPVTHTYPRDGDYEVQLTVTDEGGAQDHVAHLIPVAPNQGTGIGLRGEYYTERTGEDNWPPLDADALRVVRMDPEVNLSWPTWDDGVPAPGVGRENFAVRWRGQVQSVTSEKYFFTVKVADAARLAIDGKPLIDDLDAWSNPGQFRWPGARSREKTASIRMEAGTLYNIVLEVYQRDVIGEARLLWETETLPQQIVPRSQLYPIVE